MFKEEKKNLAVFSVVVSNHSQFLPLSKKKKKVIFMINLVLLC